MNTKRGTHEQAPPASSPPPLQRPAFQRPTLHKRTEAIQAELRSRGLHSEVARLNQSTRTVKDAADALGVEEGQIAKTVVLRYLNSWVLVIASGPRRVNMDQISDKLGSPVEPCNAQEVRKHTGYPVGGVSPLLPTHPPHAVFIDKGLERYEEIWAAAGTPDSVFSTNFEQLRELTDAEPITLV